MTNSNILIEGYYNIINSELEFISTLKARTWESPEYTQKRNEYERKQKEWYLKKAQESILNCQNEIKKVKNNLG